MRLAHFTFMDCHLHIGKPDDVDQSILQLLVAALDSDGFVGGTEWGITVEESQPLVGMASFDTTFRRNRMARCVLAWSEAQAKQAWAVSCEEAAAVGQLRQGTVRRKLELPWLAVVLLPTMANAPRSAIKEAGAIEAHVARALLMRHGSVLS